MLPLPFSVTNTGERPGSEVVQVYLARVGADTQVEPARRFVGSQKVWLVPGESRTVTIDVDPRWFASWIDGAWTVRPGEYELLVGRSSASLEVAGRLQA